MVMGVAGCGKTTVARGVAAATGLTFVEADEFHSPANIEKMRSGVPLGDAERAPWLAALAMRLGTGSPAALACSALRRSYRDVLRSGCPDLFFIHLDAPAAAIRSRMAARTDHYMPVSLLDSQIATLEPLEPDERGIVLDATLPAEVLITLASTAFPPAPLPR